MRVSEELLEQIFRDLYPVLKHFATSPENASTVAPDIAHGIQCQQWVG